MSAKILHFPIFTTNEGRVRAITNHLMESGDYTEEILAELLEYWGNLDEYSNHEWFIFFHLQRAYELILHVQGYELRMVKEDEKEN